MTISWEGDTFGHKLVTFAAMFDKVRAAVDQDARLKIATEAQKIRAIEKSLRPLIKDKKSVAEIVSVARNPVIYNCLKQLLDYPIFLKGFKVEHSKALFKKHQYVVRDLLHTSTITVDSALLSSIRWCCPLHCSAI